MFFQVPLILAQIKDQLTEYLQADAVVQVFRDAGMCCATAFWIPSRRCGFLCCRFCMAIRPSITCAISTLVLSRIPPTVRHVAVCHWRRSNNYSSDWWLPCNR